MSQKETLMTFGKYKGKSVEWVIDHNPRYAHWAHDNVEFFSITDAQYEDCSKRRGQRTRRNLITGPRDDEHEDEAEQDQQGRGFYLSDGDEWGGMSYSDFGNN